jgi:hypothetical protein
MAALIKKIEVIRSEQARFLSFVCHRQVDNFPSKISLYLVDMTRQMSLRKHEVPVAISEYPVL